ncbi:hypothetical protein D3C75_1364550 [compost metagenome]
MIVILDALFIRKLILVLHTDITTIIIKDVNVSQPISISPKLPIAGFFHFQHVFGLQELSIAIAHLVRIG